MARNPPHIARKKAIKFRKDSAVCCIGYLIRIATDIYSKNGTRNGTNQQNVLQGQQTSAHHSSGLFFPTSIWVFCWSVYWEDHSQRTWVYSTVIFLHLVSFIHVAYSPYLSEVDNWYIPLMGPWNPGSTHHLRLVVIPWVVPPSFSWTEALLVL